MVVSLNIIARIKLSCKLKNSSALIGCYSYTKRCGALVK